MSKKVTELDLLTTPTGSEYVNYISDATDRKITSDLLGEYIMANPTLKYRAVSLSVSDMENLHTTPVELIPAQGLNTMTAIHLVVMSLSGDTLWTGTDVIDFYFALNDTYISDVDTWFTSEGYDGLVTSMLQQNYVHGGLNDAFLVTQSSGALTGGNIVPTFHIWYYVISI